MGLRSAVVEFGTSLASLVRSSIQHLLELHVISAASIYRCELLLFWSSCFDHIARVVRSLVIGDGSSQSLVCFQSTQIELNCLERERCQLGNYFSTARSVMAIHSGRRIDRPRAAIDICYNSSVAQSFCIHHLQGHVL